MLQIIGRERLSGFVGDAEFLPARQCDCKSARSARKQNIAPVHARKWIGAITDTCAVAKSSHRDEMSPAESQSWAPAVLNNLHQTQEFVTSEHVTYKADSGSKLSLEPVSLRFLPLNRTQVSVDLLTVA